MAIVVVVGIQNEGNPMFDVLKHANPVDLYVGIVNITTEKMNFADGLLETLEWDAKKIENCTNALLDIMRHVDELKKLIKVMERGDFVEKYDEFLDKKVSPVGEKFGETYKKHLEHLFQNPFLVRYSRDESTQHPLHLALHQKIIGEENRSIIYR